jgi:hypothetical protein
MSAKIEVTDTCQISAEYEVSLSVGDNSYTLTVTVDGGDISSAEGEVTDYETVSGKEPGEATAERLAQAAIKEVERAYYGEGTL